MARFLIILGIFLALSVPSAIGASSETTRPRLIVGGDHDCPPYEFLENGLPTGFNIELMRAVAAVMGFDVEFRLGPWIEVRQGLEQGGIDALAGMYYSVDRSRLVDFSVPHTMVTSGIFVRKDSPIRSFEDIRGKEIIVQEGDIIHDTLKRNGLASRIVTVTDPGQELKLLASGKHDCALMPSRLQGEYFIKTFGLANIKTIKTELPQLQYCFAVRKGDQELLYQLDEGLKILKVNGKYREIYEKWFGVYERKDLWETAKNYVVVGFAVFTSLFVAGFVWSRSLQRQVRIRTAELRESEEKFRVLAETSPAAICVYQGEQIVYFNTAMTRLIGYTDQECLQMKFWDWTHPDYKEVVRERGLARQRGEPVSSRYEFKCLTKNGGEKWLFLSAGRIEYMGLPAGIATFVDITDRKRMEEELQRAYDDLEKRVEERTAELARTTGALMASEKEKSLILNNTDAFVIYYDLDMNLLWANKAAGDSVNMTPEDLRKRRCWEVWHQRREACSGCPVISTRDTGQPREGEVRAPDERVWFIRAYPVRNETGQLIGMVEFTQDITERKRAEEALRDSETRRKMAMDIARLVQWEYDVESGMFTFDDQFYALYGTTAEREGGTQMSAGDYARKFLPLEETAVVAEGLASVLANSSNQVEHRIIRADGEERVVVVRGEAVRDEAGFIAKIRGANQDITERKRMEELLRKSEAAQRSMASQLAQKNKFLRTLIDAIPDLIFYKDCNRAYLGCNRAFEAFAGRPEKDLIGCTDLDIFRTDVAISFREKDLDILSTEESRRKEEWIDYPDGRRVLLETLKTPFFDLDGEILGVVGIGRDITERNEAEEALRESESRVRRKMESILDPEGDIGELDLADILGASGVQALIDDLYRITGLKMSIIDLKGLVLADVGWQDICAKFHRNHPETLKKCYESDTDLTIGVPRGEFRTYRCKNNMWHLVTPIIIGGRHMGNLFLGQFFFAGEKVDYGLFRSQARTYGFPEDEYIAALQAVPRHSEELVNLGKAVFLRLTDMFSKLSYANIKLAHSLAERDRLTTILRKANLVVENSPAVLFRWKADDEWLVDLVSENIKQFGYAPDDFLAGSLTYSSIIHPDDLERVTREVHEYCDEGADQFRLEYRIMTKGGEVRWVNEHTNVERNAAGSVINFEGIVIDVTERMKTEEQLKRQKQQLEELNFTLEHRVQEEVAKNREKDIMLIQQNRQAAMGDLLEHIAHQWKQPLTVVSLLIQNLWNAYACSELAAEKIQDTIHKTTDLLEHMAQTIEVFRDFYRPDKEKTVFSISDSVDNALAFISPALKYQSIAVELDVDPDLLATGYPREYIQVLLNVLSNARDALRERNSEKPKIMIKGIAEGNRAVVTISDNAGGIPESIVSSIFDLYVTTKEVSGGTGIGLHMSKNIIEKNMNGSLTAHNTDSGAQFRIAINMPEDRQSLCD